MWIPIIRFELRQYLRSISTYIYFLMLGIFGFLMMIAAAGAFSNVSVTVGGKVMSNSPFSLANFIAALSYFGLLVVSAITGRAAFKDFDHRTHPFFFTAHISKGAYLGGRFIAALLILAFVFSSIGFGMALGTVMPFIEKSLVGPNRLLAYVQPYIVST